ncbi:hypothetical protein B5C34_15575 [Pacificimonas flava]|uniref:HupE / UreJ protein n=2 Tax=Pacificimonas TaxID=1960290 RepID=A0A219B135_9SPHN|nr:MULTISPECIES: HupE/UreJ family protein [Pacificimonas]MBZ6379615.1 HupE/UreJ family protein [Pacificimonas aurantium]OWV31914.1 hypothetical protein B5C34_15575 [Pacificimonas flava]
MFRYVVSALFLMLSAVPAQADVFRSADFTMARGEEAGTYEFTAEIPQAVDNELSPLWPDGCALQSSSRQSMGTRAHYGFILDCETSLRPGDLIETPWSVDGATFSSNVMGSRVSRSLAGTSEGVSVPVGEVAAEPRPVDEVARDYTWQGVIHIWMGWDHLAFVLCLCLLTQGRQLLWLVTAFTLGHSVSLALAFFEVVDVPIPPVEAVIALSIAFMAREALKSDGLRADAGRMGRNLTVVTLFGLLHGLGFASALGELGVVAGERVAGLVFFNAGVEIGQLAFVAAVVGIMALLKQAVFLQPVRVAALYGVGALGAFWMVERVAGFPWSI